MSPKRIKAEHQNKISNAITKYNNSVASLRCIVAKRGIFKSTLARLINAHTAPRGRNPALMQNEEEI